MQSRVETLVNQFALNRFGLTRGWYAVTPGQGERHGVADAKFHNGELFVLTQAASSPASTVSLVSKTGACKLVPDADHTCRSALATQPSQSSGVANLYAIGRKDVKVLDPSPTVVYDPNPTRKSTTITKEQYKTVPQVGKLIFQEKIVDVANSAPGVTNETIFVPTQIGAIERYDLGYDVERLIPRRITGRGGMSCST